MRSSDLDMFASLEDYAPHRKACCGVFASSGPPRGRRPPRPGFGGAEARSLPTTPLLGSDPGREVPACRSVQLVAVQRGPGGSGHVVEGRALHEEALVPMFEQDEGRPDVGGSGEAGDLPSLPGEALDRPGRFSGTGSDDAPEADHEGEAGPDHRREPIVWGGTSSPTTGPSLSATSAAFASATAFAGPHGAGSLDALVIELVARLIGDRGLELRHLADPPRRQRAGPVPVQAGSGGRSSTR